jgi:hypothetical protein
MNFSTPNSFVESKGFIDDEQFSTALIPKAKQRPDADSRLVIFARNSDARIV